MSWLLWQLGDSGFPAGSFVHSNGLEAAWQAGGVDRASVPQFLEEAAFQAGRASLPFVSDAHRDPKSISTLDDRCDLFLRNPVTNRASRTQGRAWLATFQRVFPAEAAAAVAARDPKRPFRAHLAPLFGATVREVGVGLEDAQRLHLYSVARGVLSAAVRLGLLGAAEAQRLLASSAPMLDAVWDRCAPLGVDDVAAVVPVLDLYGSLHDRLYSRLFMS